MYSSISGTYSIVVWRNVCKCYVIVTNFVSNCVNYRHIKSYRNANIVSYWKDKSCNNKYQYRSNSQFIIKCDFIPMFREDGAAFSTLIAELSVTLILILLGRKYIPFSLITKECFYYFIASIVMFVICVSIAQFTVYPYNIFVVIGVGLFVYITI